MYITNRTQGENVAIFLKKSLIAYLKHKRENYMTATDTFSTVIYLANDTAGFAIFDCLQVLKESNLYRHKVKKLANEGKSAFDFYEKCAKANFLDKECFKLYLDIADYFHDCMEKHVEVVRFAALNVMTRLQIPNREVLSYIITAYSCTKLAVNVFDMFFDNEKKLLGVDARKEFREYRLSGCLKAFEELADLTTGDGSTGSVQDAVSRNKDFQLTLACLQQQIVNDSYLDKAAIEGMNKNKKTVIKHLKKNENRK
mgnify:CR=1 FL=1